MAAPEGRAIEPAAAQQGQIGQLRPAELAAAPVGFLLIPTVLAQEVQWVYNSVTIPSGRGSSRRPSEVMSSIVGHAAMTIGASKQNVAHWALAGAGQVLTSTEPSRSSISRLTRLVWRAAIVRRGARVVCRAAPIVWRAARVVWRLVARLSRVVCTTCTVVRLSRVACSMALSWRIEHFQYQSAYDPQDRGNYKQTVLLIDLQHVSKESSVDVPR